MMQVVLSIEKWLYKSPQYRNELTFKYPQYQTEWFNEPYAILANNYASESMNYVYSVTPLKLLIVCTSTEHAEHVREGFLSNSHDNIKLEFIVIIENEYALSFFDYFKGLEIEDYDFIIIDQELPQIADNLIIPIQNNFYRSNFGNVKHYFDINDTIIFFKEMNALMVDSVSVPTQYFDMRQEAINFKRTVLLTFDNDEISTLCPNCFEICHVSANYEKQSDSHSCIFSEATGIGNNGIHGVGIKTDALSTAVSEISQISSTANDIFDAISIMMVGVRHRNQYFIQLLDSIRYESGIGFGLLNNWNVKLVYDLLFNYYEKQGRSQIFSFTKGDLGEADDFDVGHLTVYKAYITVRGSADYYEPRYENIPYSALPNNDGAIKEYFNTSIYICEQSEGDIKLYYLGTIEKSSYNATEKYEHLIEAVSLWNSELKGNVEIIFSKHQDIEKVESEIRRDNLLKTDLRVSVTFIGRQVSTDYDIISFLNDVSVHSSIYYSTSVNNVYIVKNALRRPIEYINLTKQTSQYHSVKLLSSGEYIIVFCPEYYEPSEILLINEECAHSQFLTVRTNIKLNILGEMVIISVVLAIIFCCLLLQK